MGCGRGCLIGLAVYCVIIAYYMYNPMPDGIEESWKYNIFQMSMKIMSHIGTVYATFGGDWRVVMRNGAVPIEYILRVDSDEHLEITNEIFDGVPVRIYNPQPARAGRPGLVYIHGGGWYMGSPVLNDHMCSYLAKKMDIVIVSVDYQFEPSPIPLQDVEAATRHLVKYYEKFGIDPSNLGVAGDSAGGNLAAAISLKFRDQSSDPQFKFQVLIYPALQVFDMVNIPAHKLNMWHISDMLNYKGLAAAFLGYMDIDIKYAPLFCQNRHVSKDTRNKYQHLVDWSRLPKQFIPNGYYATEAPVGDPQLIELMESKVMDPYNWPLMAKNLRNLPPAYVVAIQHDTLRDDALLYHVRLEQDGVHSVLNYIDSGWHAMLMNAGGPLSLDMVRRLLDDMVIFMQNQYTRPL